MATQEKKLSEIELTTVQSIKEKYKLIRNKLGDIEMSFNNLEIQKKSVLESLKELRNFESTYTKELIDKYGSGNINLKTGEIN